MRSSLIAGLLCCATRGCARSVPPSKTLEPGARHAHGHSKHILRGETGSLERSDDPFANSQDYDEISMGSWGQDSSVIKGLQENVLDSQLGMPAKDVDIVRLTEYDPLLVGQKSCRHDTYQDTSSFKYETMRSGTYCVDKTIDPHAKLNEREASNCDARGPGFFSSPHMCPPRLIKPSKKDAEEHF